MEPLRSHMPRWLSGLIIAFGELIIKKVHLRIIIIGYEELKYLFLY
jgi:hypothetical protein